MRMTRGLCEPTLEACDPGTLAHPYQGVFGWDERRDDRIWLGCGERARLGLWSRGPKEFNDEGGRHVRFALSIERGRLDELVERLRDLGVDHEGPVEHEGSDRSFCLRDPEGNVVEAWDFFEHGEGRHEGVAALA